MPKLIIHNPPLSREEIADRRLEENLKRTPRERIALMFELNKLSAKLKKGPLKEPQGLGVVVKRSPL
ncbi:MAG: hypothetical protein ACHQRM_02190 [Bacteroidia bacterium]